MADREFLLRVSYLEVYNEVVRDLLAPDSDDLSIHEDRQVGVEDILIHMESCVFLILLSLSFDDC